MLLYYLLPSAYYAFSIINTLGFKAYNDCGICSYKNNTEYRFISNDGVQPSIDIVDLAKRLGPEWIGHRMCCNDDIFNEYHKVTTYDNKIRTIQVVDKQGNKFRRSLDTRSVMECLVKVSIIYITVDILSEYIKSKSYCNNCNTYDFTSSKTITKLYSDPKSFDDILKYDEKLCSQDLKYCARIEDKKLVVRKTSDGEPPYFKNVDKAVKLNINGSIELFYTKGIREIIWIRDPFVKGQAPYYLIVSDIGSLRVIDHNDRVIYESNNFLDPKVIRHSIY